MSVFSSRTGDPQPGWPTKSPSVPPAGLRRTACAVCGPDQSYHVLHPPRIPREQPNFSARRPPTKSHFRIVECDGCGLVFSNPIFATDAIIDMYRQSGFLVEAQLDNMVQDYRRQLAAALELFSGPKESILEIGCSSGFFLKAARSLGFQRIKGVDPGIQAFERADPAIRGHLIGDVFHRGIFPPASFDVVCFFQVFDHVLDPMELLRDVHRVLRPGGVMIAINHNIRSTLTRFLGERSPMFDIEHIYLFDLDTMRMIVERAGFEVLRLSPIWNAYTLEYAIKMLPLPRLARSTSRSLLSRLNMSTARVRVPGGNMVTVARRAELRTAGTST